MGVPGLFPFIKKTFPHTIINFERDDPGHSWEFDYVYLDSNPLLHDAVRYVYNLNETKRIKDEHAGKTYEEKELIVFEMFFNKIIEVIRFITPTKVLYIAIDGCAPRAKMNQQRERRFGSGLERSEKEKLLGGDIVDTTMITPGTEFMHHLSQFVYWKIRVFLEESSKKLFGRKDVTIIYSPPTVAGEGEHKIMDYIRSLPEKERTDATHCMFGPDGDLLFLTLSAHVNKMHLFREDGDKNKQGHYNLVNSSEISAGLVKALNQEGRISRRERTVFDVSNDFTLIGFFVGNDFLPKIKMFHRLHEGLSKLFTNYIKASDRGFLLTKDNKILIEGFSHIVYGLSLSEEYYLAQQVHVTASEPKFLDNTLLQHATISLDRNGIETVSKINMVSYRQSYYNKAGIDGKNREPEFEDAVTLMCKQYFKNIIWVYRYYVEGLQSWEQSYKWHYAPLMIDLARYLNGLRYRNSSHPQILEVTTFEKSRPALPFEQLLSVISPFSYKLLPKEFHPLILDENSLLNRAGYYPKTFELDCEGTNENWKCLVLLPFVSSTVISEAYEEVNEKIKRKWHRNEPGKVCTFNYKPSGFLASFKSKYGYIENCRVKVEEIV